MSLVAHVYSHRSIPSETKYFKYGWIRCHILMMTTFLESLSLSLRAQSDEIRNEYRKTQFNNF